MCIVSQDKECGRAILATEELAKDSAKKLNETIYQVSVIDNKLNSIGISVDKLIERHEKEEQDVIIRLKEKLNEKDEIMAMAAKEAEDKKKLADARRWQIIVLAITTFFSLLGAISLLVITVKAGLNK